MQSDSHASVPTAPLVEHTLASKIDELVAQSSWELSTDESDERECLRLLSRGTQRQLFDDHSCEVGGGVDRDRAASVTLQTLSSRFRVEEKIGEGTFGLVFRVYDHELKRLVAVKILRPSLGREMRLLRRFVREAQSVAQLRNEGVVQVYDVGHLEGQPFLVMELIEGPSLLKWLKAQPGPLPIALVVELIQAIAKATAFAHSRGILHRDLKPSNILLRTEEGSYQDDNVPSPVLTDFGLAKQINNGEGTVSDLTATRELVGTIRYMSPEQASGKTEEIATTSDIFSLGVIFYELLTGRLPFRGDSNAEIIQQICHHKPQSIRALRRDVPKDLEAVVFRCLEKNPQDRYGSAAELVAELDRFLAGLPVETANPSIARRTYTAIRLQPYRSMAYGAAILSVVMYLGLWSLLASRERREHERAEANLELALHGIGRTLYKLSGDINDGLPVTHQGNLDVLLKSLDVHQQLNQRNPEDTYVLHRLAVAHYFVANGYARISDPHSAAGHREEFRSIIDRLLTKEPTNPKYVYDQFMANYLLAGELMWTGRPAEDSRVLKAIQDADSAIKMLVGRYPQNVDYLDAANTFCVFKVRSSPDNADYQQALGPAVKSSLSLAAQHPERPLLAKPGIVALCQQAKYAMVQLRYGDAERLADQAYNLLQEKFPEVSRDGECWHHCFEILYVRVYTRLVRRDWKEADKIAEEAIGCWAKADAYQKLSAAPLVELHRLRQANHAKLGLHQESLAFRARAEEIAAEHDVDPLDIGTWQWINGFLEDGLEIAGSPIRY